MAVQVLICQIAQIKLQLRYSEQNGDFASGQLSRIRYNALPQIEKEGNVKNLRLGTGDGLYEAAHFVYFLKSNILAMELNIHAPRPETFGKYLVHKLKDHRSVLLDNIFCNPIIRGDTLDEVLHMGNIAEFEINC